MSLTLIQNSRVVGQGISVAFSGKGGTPPYYYSVLPGGAGGNMTNTVSGIYVAPNKSGIDTIRVTDSTSPTHLTATAEIIVGDALDILCDIIQTEMGLPEGRVYPWNGKSFQPHDSGLYIPISFMPLKVYANNRKQNPVMYQGIVYSQHVLVKGIADIHLKSRSSDARDRKEELIMSLASSYSQSQQQLNAFKIFSIPSGFVDVSSEDGPAIPFHFVISVTMLYYKAKTTVGPCFDQFGEVQTKVNP